MKRTWTWACLLLLICLLQTSVALAVGISPAYTHTKSVKASLEITGGAASCGGAVIAKSINHTAYITMKLMRQDDTKWTTVGIWTSNGKGKVALGKSVGVTAGEKYQVIVVGKIKDEDNNTVEDVSVKSKIVTAK